jgi:hypothetical protein
VWQVMTDPSTVAPFPATTSVQAKEGTIMPVIQRNPINARKTKPEQRLNIKRLLSRRSQIKDE